MSLEDELAAFEAELAQVEAETEERPRVGIVSAKPLLKEDDSKKKLAKTPTSKPKRKRDENSTNSTPHFPTVPLPPDMNNHSERNGEEKEKEKEKKVKIISAAAVKAEPEELKLLETALAEDIVAVTHVPAIQAAAAIAKTAPKDKKVFLRRAAGKIWADTSLGDWPDSDNRIFCGDLGNEVNDNTLAKVFVKYASFAKAKVVRDKRTQKTKGYGFVSFLDPFDCAQALKEMQGAYVGNRPIKLRKSSWLKREHVPKNRPKNHLW
jgi:hypothetical protein